MGYRFRRRCERDLLKGSLKIVDWAGNDKSHYFGTFDTPEDAWAALYKEFEDLDEDEFNEVTCEFYVDEIEY